ncbi:MAG: riboflavin synthase [Acidobacteriota bacterium]|nr:riboflavin synthase [Acidobacteriota bacterium]
MFTGIIEEVGIVATPGPRMKVRCRRTLRDATEGSSIAVNGVCLTATSLESDGFWADLAPETLSRTNLGDLQADSEVNLERPLAVGDRLSGHMVQGHVDGTATVVSLQPLGDGNWWLTVRVPAELSRYMIHKGSVTLDGISLTIAAIQDHLVSAAIIPHTYEHTALRRLAPGARINVEPDLIAKYVEKLML